MKLDGVPSETPPGDGARYFWFDPQGVWRVDQGDQSFDIDAVCVALHDQLAAAIFGGLDVFHALLPSLPEWVFMAGLNSESSLSRERFEQLVTMAAGDPLHRLLYLYDCRKLVTGVQEGTKEVTHLQGEFYRALNLDDLFYPPWANPDGLRFISSPVTTNIIAILNYIFVRLHSLLDYTTRLVYEIEHLRSSFETYPRLASSNIQCSDRKRLSANGQVGTLFERCSLITEVETIRNLVIHDGFLDEMPKVYQHTEAGRTLRRFVLMPDLVDGRLAKYKNRNLFYAIDDQINLRLPSLVSEFQKRQLLSLELARLPLGEIVERRAGTGASKSSR